MEQKEEKDKEPNWEIGSNQKMSCSLSLHVPKALPPLPYYSSRSLFIASKHKPFHNNTTSTLSNQSLHIGKCSSQKPNDPISLKKPNLALPIGALLLALADSPAALAVTGLNNNPQELWWILTQLGVVFFFYFLVGPVSFNFTSYEVCHYI